MEYDKDKTTKIDDFGNNFFFICEFIHHNVIMINNYN